jgi:hypothetical protein
MADEGPTTAGSIVGKLKMDRDQWIVEKQATIADAKEIADLNPTVTVHANVAEALAEMEGLKGAGDSTSTVGVNVSGGSAASVDAVTAAEAKMTAAMTAARIAAQAEELAAQRLDAAQTARGRTDISVAAAELALERATKTTTAAQEKALTTAQALRVARQEAAFATYDEAKAEDTSSRSADNAGGSLSRIQMILAAVVALGPGLIPIAGFTVGAGAAISAMAGVAVLAVLGIKNELKSGTAEAQTFQAGINSLKADVSELEKTAATGVLGGFQTVVGELHADMPELNSETKTYSQILGAIAGTGFGGVLSFFHSLAPLILDVDSYLLDTTNKLSAFADSPGMRKFVTYAQQSLPTVERLLNSLVAVAFHLLAAFAPWGTLVVDVLTDVSNVISMIPTPVLSTLIELALGGSLAFKAWTSIPAMFMSLAATIGATAVAEDGATIATGALGAAIDFMEGPIGWVVAGISALVAVFAASAVSAGASAQAVNSYTAALEQDNGVIGENVRLAAAKALQDSGAATAAKSLGISTVTLTSASLGNAGAIKTVSDALDKQKSKLDEGVKAAQGNRGAALLVTQTQHDQRAAIDLVSSSMDTQIASVKSSISSYDDLQLASGALQGTNQQQADAYGRLADEEDAATKAAELWQTQLDILNGKTQTLEGANIALAGDFQSMASTITQNAKTMGAAAAHSLDINTAGGLANHQIALQAVKDAETQSQAIISAEGNTAKAREDGRQALIKSRQSIIDHMVALGLDRAAVTALVDSELTIPAHIETKLEIETAAAIAALKAAQAEIQKTLTISHGVVSFTGSPRGMIGHAGGGTVTGNGGPTQDNQIRALSVGEEVTRSSRAQAFRPMLKALNNGSANDIKRAASAIAGPSMSGGSSPVSISITNKTGVALGDLIDLHIEQNGQWQAMHLDSGVAK